MKREELLQNKELRNENLGRIEVLDQVKELLLLGDTEFATTEMVAEYYGVGKEAINSCIKDNRMELESNGLKVYKGSELANSDVMSFKDFTKNRANFKFTLETGDVLSVGGKGITLFSKRAILNVGMLLTESSVAEEVRSRLLDVAQDAEVKTASIKAIVEEIDEEKQLMMDRIQAEMDGDFDKVCVINAKLFALKNKRIKELEDINEVIINHSTTIEESRDVINRLVRLIASKTKIAFGSAFNEFYSTLNYKLKINIKSRDKKKGQSYLDTLSTEEMYKAEEVARNWATKLGIDVKEQLALS